MHQSLIVVWLSVQAPWGGGGGEGGKSIVRVKKCFSVLGTRVFVSGGGGQSLIGPSMVVIGVCFNFSAVYSVRRIPSSAPAGVTGRDTASGDVEGALCTTHPEPTGKGDVPPWRSWLVQSVTFRENLGEDPPSPTPHPFLSSPCESNAVNVV